MRSSRPILWSVSVTHLELEEVLVSIQSKNFRWKMSGPRNGWRCVNLAHHKLTCIIAFCAVVPSDTMIRWQIRHWSENYSSAENGFHVTRSWSSGSTCAWTTIRYGVWAMNIFIMGIFYAYHFFYKIHIAVRAHIPVSKYGSGHFLDNAENIFNFPPPLYFS